MGLSFFIYNRILGIYLAINVMLCHVHMYARECVCEGGVDVSHPHNKPGNRCCRPLAITLPFEEMKGESSISQPLRLDFWFPESFPETSTRQTVQSSVGVYMQLSAG